jgi:UDP-2,3-diacylglucosamine hydrolase
MHDSTQAVDNASKEAQPKTVALFVSDVHLQESLPRTTQAFFDFLERHATRAQQLYFLGDLFEYWAGDDDIASPYNQRVIDAIRRVSDAGVAVFWIAGNRDFLVGEAFAAATGATLLPDPFVTTIAGQKLVLAHGDAQCTDDVSYMAFRAQVRQAEWQKQFLEMPLAKRKAIIESLRKESRAAQSAKSYDITDVNAAAIAALFDTTSTALMIHGHTHRPARHSYSAPDRVRYVLPDWDCDIESPRGGWIAIGSDGVIRRIGVDGFEEATVAEI